MGGRPTSLHLVPLPDGAAMSVVLIVRHHLVPSAPVPHLHPAGDQPLLPLWWQRGLHQCGVSIKRVNDTHLFMIDFTYSLTSWNASVSFQIIESNINWQKHEEGRVRHFCSEQFFQLGHKWLTTGENSKKRRCEKVKWNTDINVNKWCRAQKTPPPPGWM